MRMSGNTILITGGATGIGHAMAGSFLARCNTVIICSRREDRLAQAARELPGVHTVRCDVSDPGDRNELLKYMSEKFPEVNILINNAGIQRDIDLTKEIPDAENDEVRINFEAPICLSSLFVPLLSGKDNAAIMNVTSGLAFNVERAAGMPIYCATKAGLHAFSIAQRVQLAPLGIRVVEIIPPMVESELNIEGRRKRNMLKSPYMMTSDEYVEKALVKVEEGLDEVRFEGRFGK